MKTRIALFALALALPLAACETEPDVIENDTITVETPDVDATMNNVEDDLDGAGAAMEDNMEDAGESMEAAGEEMEAEAAEAGAAVEDAVDGDNDM